MPLNKKLLSKLDSSTKYITPALEAAGWNKRNRSSLLDLGNLMLPEITEAMIYQETLYF